MSWLTTDCSGSVVKAPSNNTEDWPCLQANFRGAVLFIVKGQLQDINAACLTCQFPQLSAGWDG